MLQMYNKNQLNRKTVVFFLQKIENSEILVKKCIFSLPDLVFQQAFRFSTFFQYQIILSCEPY